MNLFRCTCNESPTLFFENTHCAACDRLVGFDPGSLKMKPFKPDPILEGIWRDEAGAPFSKCVNWQQHNVCNWMVALPNSFEGSMDLSPPFCLACRCNLVIPDLSNNLNQILWGRMEVAKRRCLYTLSALNLPFLDCPHLPADLATLRFKFMNDKTPDSHFRRPIAGVPPVITGHLNGTVTINLAEADDVARTHTQSEMDENYRTLLGHFRHETGHYYWSVFDRLDPGFASRCRDTFGDERLDYTAALERYYATGPVENWQETFVSPYASAHPSEDWAECWSHYLHMLDTLETHSSFSALLRGFESADSLTTEDIHSHRVSFDALMTRWMDMTVYLNGLNQSMGMPDPYPFVLTVSVQAKIRCIHEEIDRAIDLLL
ncbi:MAG: putative zinc-binding metallopeptidase [Hahellaceae bacterium]|nr:putative zinc-binding metallopeptidase [Hahellaceae bacterium]